VKTFASHVYESVQTVDILVNNAGVALDKWVSAMESDIDVWRKTMEVNLYGALRMCQAFAPGMKAAAFGRIVNVSSELGSLTNMQMGSSVAYRSSKTALNSLTLLLARELKDHLETLVNASYPGWVKTELGGDDAPLTPAQGADTTVWLATLPALAVVFIVRAGFGLGEN
jgi:NAD(P)-dependent dehydrogenase (short-subunit alcohol dehydrogenase family)